MSLKGFLLTQKKQGGFHLNKFLMPLLDRSKSPPGGFPYREPSINWSSPADGAIFTERVKQISAARANNPSATLDPSYEACSAALDLYTCARLHNDPKWCVPSGDAVARTLAQARQPVPCAGCGGGKRKKKSVDTSVRAEDALKTIKKSK